jgi:hypothetical protein
MTDTRTQCAKIHALLKSGPITNDHIYRMLHTHRGSARICDLRQHGVPIETTYIKAGKAWIAQYKLAGWKASYVEDVA